MNVALLSNVRRQVLIAAWVGLVGGTLLGLSLGGILATLENASLVLSDARVRVCVPMLLAALGAWLSVVLLLPLALLLACVQAAWPKLHALRARRLYACTLVAGSSFAFASLWVVFCVVRDVTAPRSVAMLIGVAVVSCAAFLLPPWSGPSRSAAEEAPQAGLVVTGLALTGLLGFAAYAYLAAHLPGHGAQLPPTAARPAATDGTAHPLDVILVSIDTLRADHLSASGYARHTSPQLDQLAADGVSFVNARSQAPWTLPSHAAMLTGRYPSSCGVRFAHNFRFLNRGVADKLPRWNVTLAESLHAAGFRTAAFTSVEYLTPTFGFDRGFEQMETMNPGSATHAATAVDKAIEWLAADVSRSAFLFLHVYSVHQYSSPSEYDALYQVPDYHGPLKGRPRLAIPNLFESLSDADLQYLIAKYDGALRYVDDQLGRLFAWLRAHGRYDRSLLIITADHGEEFWEHGGTGHGFTLYDEQLRVPLIIKPPAGFAVHASRSSALAGLIDIAPTVLDYVGLPRPPLMDGTTLRPAVEAGTALDRPLFAEATFFFNSYAMIGPAYKYIDNRVPPLEPLNVGLLLANIRSLYRFREDELYQIEHDPREQANLLTTQPVVASHMQAELRAHLRAAQPSESIGLDAATRERLRALGYVH